MSNAYFRIEDLLNKAEAICWFICAFDSNTILDGSQLYFAISDLLDKIKEISGLLPMVSNDQEVKAYKEKAAAYHLRAMDLERQLLKNNIEPIPDQVEEWLKRPEGSQKDEEKEHDTDSSVSA